MDQVLKIEEKAQVKWWWRGGSKEERVAEADKVASTRPSFHCCDNVTMYPPVLLLINSYR